MCVLTETNFAFEKQIIQNWSPVSPKTREGHVVMSVQETADCLLAKLCKQLLSPLESTGHFCILSISVSDATVCLCCCMEFGWKDRSALLGV